MSKSISPTGRRMTTLSSDSPIRHSIKITISVIFAIFISMSFIFCGRQGGNIKEDFTGCFYYRLMPDNLQRGYEAIYNGIYAMENKIKIDLTEKELEKVFYCLIFDNPEIIWVADDYSYEKQGDKAKWICPRYIMDKEDEILEKKEALEEIRDEIIKQTNEMTVDYAKALYVHDYIASRCSYVEHGESVNSHTAYGALVEGKASCRGYSAAFQYLLSAVGVKTGQCMGTVGNNEGHSWNFIITGGSACYTDVCFDDANFSSFFIHGFFCISRDEMEKSHNFAKGNEVLYEVQSDFSSSVVNIAYYENNGLFARNMEDAYIIMTKKLRLLDENRRMIEIKCFDDSTFKSLNVVLKRVMAKEGYKWLTVTKLEDVNVLVISK